MVRYYKEQSPYRKKHSMITRQESALDIMGGHDDLETAFPLPLAIVVVFLYIIVVAGLIKAANKDWDYFTAFYYFFISLSTIGLGDKVALPENNNYVLWFIYTLIGLSLVSMCLNVIQNRTEQIYIRALTSIDAILQLSAELNDSDEEAAMSPYAEHPDWAVFRASQVLGTLNIRRMESRLRLSDRSNNANDARRKSIYSSRKSMQMRQSIFQNYLSHPPQRSAITKLERQATRLKSMERQATRLRCIEEQAVQLRRKSVFTSSTDNPDVLAKRASETEEPKRISKQMNVRFSVTPEEHINRVSIGAESTMSVDGAVLERY